MTLGNVQAHKCAIWFATRGIPVFPLHAGAKKPANNNGFKGATTDPDIIAHWWPATHTGDAYNIGVPTGSAFDVIDIDHHHEPNDQCRNPDRNCPKNGFDTLATLDWCATLDRDVHAVVATAGGGLHLWVPATGSGNTAGWAPGIDYRGMGGYVVVPPSKTRTAEWRFIRQYTPEATPMTNEETMSVGRVIWTPTTG